MGLETMLEVPIRESSRILESHLKSRVLALVIQPGFSGCSSFLPEALPVYPESVEEDHAVGQLPDEVPVSRGYLVTISGLDVLSPG